MPASPFEEIERLAAESGVEKTLDFLEQIFRQEREYFRLFELLKMRCRHRMGLPLTYSRQPDSLSESQKRQLEDALLEVCREIGTLFFQRGQFQEGWMYLQPVGDKALSEQLVRAIETDEENTDALIDIAVSQGAAPIYGYSLLLKHYGTCNGITTFDTQAGRFDGDTQRELARRLLRHLYDELLANVNYAVNQVRMDIGEAEQKPAASLAEAMQAFPELTAGGAHHVDATHLAAAMRISRVVEDPQDLRMASELAEYGSRLAEDYQYPGHPPFEDTYNDHKYFFDALRGKNVDAAISHFKRKLESGDDQQLGPVVEETLVDFLFRLGRNEEALALATTRLLGKHESLGIAPSALEIATTPNSLQQLMEFYQSKDDLLGFAVSVLTQRSMKSEQASKNSP